MKENRKLNLQKIIMVIIIIYIIIYVMYSIIRLIVNPTDTMLVENGKIYMEESSQGYIIRDETIVKGENYKNGMEKIRAEGEKVAKGESIFRYYTQNEEEIKNKIQNLDTKIQEVLSNEKDLFSSDLKLIDKQIEEKLENLYKKNNVQEIDEIKKEINTYITKKAKISGELSPSGSYLKKMVAERTTYENQLNTESEKIVAPTSGVVSYRIDGLEEKFTTNDFSYLTVDFLQSLNLKTGQIVPSNEESGKIVNNYKCYVAAVLTSEEAKQAKVNDVVRIRLSNSKEITTKIVSANTGDKGQVILVFEINDFVEDLTGYRKMSFDVIWWGMSGMKISNKSIIKENDLNYVVRTREGYTDKILVKIVKQDANYSIITSYTMQELKELGFNAEEIKSIKKINVYDEILLKS